MSESADPSCLSAPPYQMLVKVARHSQIGDPEGCATLLALLATGRSLRAHLQQVLAGLNLSEAKFSVLVSLYAADPAPLAPADLAQQSGISRATITDALGGLCADRSIQREPASTDRRAFVIRLTDHGRTVTEDAIRPFLTAIATCSDALSLSEQQAVKKVCAHVDHRLPSLTS